MDLRFATTLADTKSCNVDNEAGDLGVAGAKLLVPGSPEESLLSVRLRSPARQTDAPLASSVVDDDGMKVLDDRIRSLAGCPSDASMRPTWPSTCSKTKTVVGTRMKREGARFSQHGGQAVLRFRTALLSSRSEVDARCREWSCASLIAICPRGD